MARLGAEFPTTFTDTPLVLTPQHVQPKHADIISGLESRGYGIVAGLREQDVQDITRIAGQPGVREFCPKDIRQRWTNIDATRKQLNKDGGRGVFRLVKLVDHLDPIDGDTVGYGWTGKSSEDERAKLPRCENTFAIRLDSAVARQGLGRRFTAGIVVGSMALFNAHNIGLETWASNVGAVKSYFGAAAEFVTGQNSERVTRNLDEAVRTEIIDGEEIGIRPDTRYYMQFPWSMNH